MSTLPRRSSLKNGDLTASAALVNRVHRVVRQEAVSLQERNRRWRSFLVPVALCFCLLLAAGFSIWSSLAGYDATPTGIPDASDQLLLLTLWLLPVTILLFGLVYLRRKSTPFSDGEAS